MSENPRRGRQERNFTTNVPKILDLKSPSEQIFFRKLSLGAPESKSSRPRIFLSFSACDCVVSKDFTFVGRIINGAENIATRVQIYNVRVYQARKFNKKRAASGRLI